MNVRVFGAQQGPGSQIREIEGDAPVDSGQLGSTVIVGMFRSGPVGRFVALLDGVGQYHRTYGGLTQDSQAPLATEDFYKLSQGAGVLYVLRVTDGTEIQAALKVFDRNVDRSIASQAPSLKFAAQIATLKAANGGRWGGRRGVLAGKVDDLSAAFDGASFDTGRTVLLDEWKGAVLRFPVDEAGKTFTVAGNNTAGVLALDAGADAALLAGADGRWTLELDNVHEVTGAREALTVEIANGDEDPIRQFTLNVGRDGGSVSSYANLSVDTGSSAYWLTALTSDESNVEIAPIDLFSGSITDELQRPANFAEIPVGGGIDGNVVTFEVVRWSRTGSSKPYVNTREIVWGSDPRPCSIVLTFAGDTTFTVAATFDDGRTVQDLPTGTVGTPYDPQHPWLPGFLVGTGWMNTQAADTLTMIVRTLPPNLANQGAYLYPFASSADGDVRRRYRVVSNDHRSVTLASSVVLGTDEPGFTAPAPAIYTGANAGPFDLSSGTKTVIYRLEDGISGYNYKTLTATGTDAATSAATLAADLNAAELARVTGDTAQIRVVFGATADNELTISSARDFGSRAGLVIGGGGLNTLLGFTEDAEVFGTDGVIARLQWRQELAGGTDGNAGIADADYETAWDTDTGPLRSLVTTKTGLLTVGTPGVTAQAVQAAMQAWTYATNSDAVTELPSDKITEAAAIAWHEANLMIGDESRYAQTYYPSYGIRPNPYGTGNMTATLTGAILGLYARKAVDGKGYQNAPAGQDYGLASIFKDLTTGNTPINSEAINGYGLNEVRRRGAAIYLWGDRTVTPTGRDWLHKRRAMSHIGRVLFNGLDGLVFKKIDDIGLADAKRVLRGIFLEWWRARWFSDTDGSAFEDAVSIKVDKTNNTAATKAAGNLEASIGFGIVDTSERVVITIGPKGVQEGPA